MTHFSPTTTTGLEGEEMATSYLESLGHKIISRNFKTKFGEIDIISVDKSGITVFTEVKSIRQAIPKRASILDAEKSFPHTIPETGDKSADALYPNTAFRPEDNYTKKKSYKFRRIARFYANAHPETIGDKGYRLDLITLTISFDNVVINLYENI